MYALTAEGKVAWRTNLWDNVLQVAARDLDGDGVDEIVVTTPKALYALDPKGKLIGAFAAAAKITSAAVGEKLLLATTDGRVRELVLAAASRGRR